MRYILGEKCDGEETILGKVGEQRKRCLVQTDLKLGNSGRYHFLRKFVPCVNCSVRELRPDVFQDTGRF